jgi:hypothetical protein
MVRLLDEGRLGTYPNDPAFLRSDSGFLIDTATGVLRRGKIVEQWRTVQTGSESNDYVAVLGRGEASAATDFIRVRAWKLQPTVTFLQFSLSTITTGACEIIR